MLLPVVTGGGESEEAPLEGRTLRSWTWPFGVTDGPFGRMRSGSGLEEEALVSAEGQERAERETKENLTLLYVGTTRAQHKLVFAHREGKYAWLQKLSVVDSLLDPNLPDGEYDLPGIDSSYVVRRLNAEMIDECSQAAREQDSWISLPENPATPEYSPRFHSPSQASAQANDAALEVTELPGPSQFPSGATKVTMQRSETRSTAI